MKKLLLSLSFLATISYAQIPVAAVPNPDFTAGINDSCKVDTSMMVNQFIEWQVYHTVDNTWNGEIDSNFCFNSYDPSESGLFLDYTESDPSKYVFARALIDPVEAFQFKENWIYKVEMPFENRDIFIDTSCADCNKVIMGIRTPNSSYSDDTLKYYEYAIEFKSMYSANWAEFCFPTEEFTSTNHLDSFIIQLKLLDDASIDKRVRLERVTMYDMGLEGPPNYLTEALIPSYSTSSNVYELTAWWWPSSNYMVLYDTSAYPSAINQSYLDVTPLPNPTDSQHVDIIVQEFASLFFQPYSNFRGGLVEGSTSWRHSYSVINYGSNICIEPFVEVAFEADNSYIHRSGNLSFQTGSCFLLKAGGQLVIDENATLTYGHKSTGMLALSSGGRLRFAKDAKLNMNGTLVLLNKAGNKEDHEIYLNTGNSLVFGRKSRIKTSHPDSRLIIHNNGGFIDLSRLPSEDQKKVIILENEAEKDQFEVIGNLITEPNLHIQYFSTEAKSRQYSIYCLDGSLVRQENIDILPGKNTFRLNLGALDKGTYIISLDGEKKTGAKFVYQ